MQSGPDSSLHSEVSDEDGTILMDVSKDRAGYNVCSSEVSGRVQRVELEALVRSLEEAKKRLEEEACFPLA